MGSIENNHRHFKPEIYKDINELMEKIGKGDANAANDFVKLVQPVINNTAQRIAVQVFGKSNVDDEVVKETVNTVLGKLFENKNNPQYFAGDSKSWSNFENSTQNKLRDIFKSIKNQQNESKEAMEKIGDYNVKGYNNSRYSLPTPQRNDDPAFILEIKEKRKALSSALKKLPSRQAEVITSHYEGETDKEIGGKIGISRQRVNEIGRNAHNRLRGDITLRDTFSR